jgi:MFS family permease
MGLACGVGFQTLLQAITDDQFRGRVLGALGTTYMLLMLIGEALGSLLADTLGVLPLLYTASSFYVLAGLLGLFVLPAATVGIATAAGQVPDDVGR